ncbi:MAG: ATP synthase F0 subunit B [Thermoanaerobaculales bacterium]|nr:ATP synthase F0 subunit B [Thermoanaerobaculales bacterium]
MTPPNLSLVFIILCFWVTLWLVHRFLIQPVTTVLEERNSRIDSAEKEWAAKNEALVSATARLEEELSEAARSASRAREAYCAEAQAARRQRMEGARERADEELRVAVADLAREAETARKELHNQATLLAQELATRLVGREVLS